MLARFPSSRPIVMACIDMAYIDMAYIDMAYIVIVHIVMACIVMADEYVGEVPDEQGEQYVGGGLGSYAEGVIRRYL